MQLLRSPEFNHLADTVRDAEALSLVAYECPTGHRTIGYGHRMDSEDPETVSEEWAERTLEDDLAAALANTDVLLRRHCGNRETEPARVTALAEMVFQIGLPGVEEFERMWAAIATDDWRTAAEEMTYSLWHEQTPRRCERLALQVLLGLIVARSAWRRWRQRHVKLSRMERLDRGATTLTLTASLADYT